MINDLRMKTKINRYLYTSALLVGAFVLLIVNSCKKEDTSEPGPQASVESYYPNSGKAGTLVTIKGQGFLTDITKTSIAFGDASAEILNVQSDKIVVRTPAGDGRPIIQLKQANTTIEVGTYTYQALSVQEVFPANGPAGAHIRIRGEGFSSLAAPALVTINGKDAVVMSASDTLLVAEVPEEAGSGPIGVHVDGKEALGQNFTYQAIHSIKPKTGGKGTKVVITGAGFEALAAGNKVDFNGKEAEVTFASQDTLIVAAPEGVETGPLSVTINNQKITGPVFTQVPPPTIQTVSPLSGPVGAVVTIVGSGFSTELGENKVVVNGVTIPVSSVTASELKFTLPTGVSSGKLIVVVNDQSKEGPVFKTQTLGITAVSPDNGLAGTEVVISGSGFSSNVNENTVTFNGVKATVLNASENSITVQAPSNLTTGALKVTVGSLEALAPSNFRRAGVITLAGGPGSSDLGSDLTAMAIDSHGNLFVVDRSNGVIKKITSNGVVSTLQGQSGDIHLDSPYGLVIDKQDNLYVSEPNTQRILKISPSGQQQVYVSNIPASHLGIDQTGNLYAANVQIGGGMFKIFAGGGKQTISGPNWVFSRPAIDLSGNVYYTDQNLNGISGIAKTPASGGTNGQWAGIYEAGYVDGIGADARFNGVTSVILANSNELLVTDRFNYALRRVNITSREVTTAMKASAGYEDGTLANAKFNILTDIAIDRDGNIYVLDVGNQAIRKVFLK